MLELIDHRILDIAVCPNERFLKFTTQHNLGVEDYIYEATGDCCSESWFSEIINLDFLIGNIITQVETLLLPNHNMIDGNCRQEVDSFYGYRLATKAGHTTIVFRCSSNGYYGGDCHLINFVPENTAHMKSIKHLSDWTAYEITSQSYYHTLKLRAFL